MTIEQMLRASAANLDWPETPNIAAAVMARIPAADAPERHPHPLRLRRAFAVAFAALLLLAATAAAIPAIRDPVLDWLGLRSVRIERVPAPLPEAPGQRLGLGRHVTLAAVRSKLGFTPVLPTALGRPTAYYEGFPPGGQLGLVYPHGIVISEVQGRLETRFLVKFLPPGTKADRVTINGERALWIHGAPHQYAYRDRTGAIRTDSVRTAGNVLLWRHGDLLIRIEGAGSKPRALAVARSARAAP